MLSLVIICGVCKVEQKTVMGKCQNCGGHLYSFMRTGHVYCCVIVSNE